MFDVDAVRLSCGDVFIMTGMNAILSPGHISWITLPFSWWFEVFFATSPPRAVVVVVDKSGNPRGDDKFSDENLKCPLG